MLYQIVDGARTGTRTPTHCPDAGKTRPSKERPCASPRGLLETAIPVSKPADWPEALAPTALGVLRDRRVLVLI